MAGHGHVPPNTDDSKARCGGPMICPQCSREFVAANRVSTVGPLQAEVARLAEQLRIAEAALVHIVQIADRGADGPSIGIYAHDALARMEGAQ